MTPINRQFLTDLGILHARCDFDRQHCICGPKVCDTLALLGRIGGLERAAIDLLADLTPEAVDRAAPGWAAIEPNLPGLIRPDYADLLEVVGLSDA